MMSSVKQKYERRMEPAVVGDPSAAGTSKMVRAYGDTTGDGMVQLSFTLPLPHDKRAEGAALQLAKKMGMEPAMLVHAKAMGSGFTFFVVYGAVSHVVDLRQVKVVEREFPLLSSKEVNTGIRDTLKRRLVVVGACIGTDAHTVGIDAILNIKGFAGEKGLEYYSEIKVVNLGAQVLVPDLVARAQAEQADTALFNSLRANAKPLLVIGGPRFEDDAAERLGVDRIFGRGTTPSEVASYLVHAVQTKGARKRPAKKG